MLYPLSYGGMAMSTCGIVAPAREEQFYSSASKRSTCVSSLSSSAATGRFPPTSSHPSVPSSQHGAARLLDRRPRLRLDGASRSCC